MAGPKIIITGDPMSLPYLIWLISFDDGVTYKKANFHGPSILASNDLRADLIGPIQSLLACFVNASSGIQLQKTGPVNLVISQDTSTATTKVVWTLNGIVLNAGAVPADLSELPQEFGNFKLSQMSTGGIPVGVVSLNLT